MKIITLNAEQTAVGVLIAVDRTKTQQLGITKHVVTREHLK